MVVSIIDIKRKQMMMEILRSCSVLRLLLIKLLDLVSKDFLVMRLKMPLKTYRGQSIIWKAKYGFFNWNLKIKLLLKLEKFAFNRV